MSSGPLVSVIMGVYNCEKEIEQCISSIQKQTYKNWELIICDDCSTDYTFEIVRSIANGDSRINIIKNEKNRKLAYSLNQCLKYAKGKYIARMDADDIALPFRIEKQVVFLNEHPEYAVVGSGLIPFDEFNESKPRIPKEEPKVLDMLKDVPFYHPTIMVRREVYTSLNGYTVSKRTVRGQDMDLWFRFFAAGYKGYNLQEALLKYHESMQDYNKTGIRISLRAVQTKLIGFRINDFPIYLYPFALKPVITSLIPKKIMYLYHHKKQ